MSETLQDLHLVEARESHSEGLRQIYGDPLTTRYLSFSPRNTDQIAQLLKDAERQRTVSPRRIYFQVAELLDVIVGVGRLEHGVTWPNSGADPQISATVGLAVRSDLVRMGIGKTLLAQLVALAWSSRTATSILWGAADPENGPSVSLMMGLGFVRKGQVPNHVTRSGRLRPSDIYELGR